MTGTLRQARASRRRADSIDALIAGTQNLINQHDLNILHGKSALNAHSRLYSVHAHMYVCAGVRYFSFEGRRSAHNVLELASINVYEEYQQQGICRDVLRAFENLANINGRVLRVECVVSLIVDKMLCRRGYERDIGDPQCFIRPQPPMAKLA